MKKTILILLVLFSMQGFSQSLKKLSNYKTDSITKLPLQEVVTNFYIDWGVNSNGNIDSTSQIIIVNIKQYVMTPDSITIINTRSRQKRVQQGTDDFNRWFNHFEDFGNLIYQELINDSISK